MNPDKENIRFGILAVQKGFATPENIVTALEVQVRENFSTGRHRLIGEILLEQGYLSEFQIGEILQTLH